jgi:hypothetical protein
MADSAVERGGGVNRVTLCPACDKPRAAVLAIAPSPTMQMSLRLLRGGSDVWGHDAIIAPSSCALFAWLDGRTRRAAEKIARQDLQVAEALAIIMPLLAW